MPSFANLLSMAILSPETSMLLGFTTPGVHMREATLCPVNVLQAHHAQLATYDMGDRRAAVDQALGPDK